MLKNECCNGQNCHKRDICQRYVDYLYRLSIDKNIKPDIKSTSEKECQHFDIRRFTGD